MPDGSELSFKTLASWLNTYVKGRVFVILESCGAGSSVYPSKPPYLEENASAKAEQSDQDDSEELLSKAIKAFAEVDHSITIANPDGQKGGVSANSTGDFTKFENKFYVLAAADHHEDSYGWEDSTSVSGSYNFFTYWLILGIGNKGNSPADKSKNGSLSLYELYNYIKTEPDKHTINHKPYPKQSVQCYAGELHYTDDLFKLK